MIDEAMNHSLSKKAWYLIYSKTRQEHVARENLERQGYTVYLPELRERRRRRGAFVNIVEPLFPRYLFIRLDSVLDNWAPIRSTIGVAKMVRFGDLPVPVPDDLLDAIRNRACIDGVIEIPEHQFREGERVRIVDGPMSGYEAIFSASDSKERVVLLFDIVGKQTPLTMPAMYIQALS